MTKGFGNLMRQAQQLQANEERHRLEWDGMVAAWMAGKQAFAAEIRKIKSDAQLPF